MATWWESVETGKFLLADAKPGDTWVMANHCQNGRDDICLAGNADGICCPDDSCDINDGIRHCPHCGGDGMDPMNDYLLPCPGCGGQP